MEDNKLAMLISRLMRWGVILAITSAFIGGAILLVNHGQEPINFSVYTASHQSILPILKSVTDSVLNGSGRGFILLGIIILFATPILRVILSLVGFMLEKDYLYVFITLIVLIVMAISISGGLH